MIRNFKLNYREASVGIIAEVSMPCPPGEYNGIFRTKKAFLCYFENLPFQNGNGVMSTISGYMVVDDPQGKLIDWVESPLESVDAEWNDADLFSETPQGAVEQKIKDLEAIWIETSLCTLCQFCKAKGEQCKKQLAKLFQSSNKNSFSFSLFSNPGAPKTYMGWKKEVCS